MPDWAWFVLVLWTVSGAVAGALDVVCESDDKKTSGSFVALVVVVIGALAGPAYWVMVAETVHNMRGRR